MWRRKYWEDRRYIELQNNIIEFDNDDAFCLFSKRKIDFQIKERRMCPMSSYLLNAIDYQE